MAELRFTILGCGSSGGVPRLGGKWGACDPTNPKNTRRRCSLLVERIDNGQTTTALIDTSPDMRAQLLDAGIGRLDGVLYTHAHADHVHGVDDLRMIVMNMRERLSVWAEPATQDALMTRFGYVFVQPEDSPYPAILDMKTIEDEVIVEGPGGPIAFEAIRVDHGSIAALGFRVGPVVYTPDIKHMTPQSWAAAKGAQCWILDALRRDPHPTHIHLDGALEWIETAHPEHAILTNMHLDLDYATVAEETPENVSPAFDGMVLSFQV